MRSYEDAIASQIGTLIRFGRDREAAELATETTTARHDQGQRGVDMEVLSQFEQLGPALAEVVGNIRADQLDNPTHCSGFDVRGVLEHMIGGATTFAAAFRGEAPSATSTSNVLAAFGPALSELLTAITAAGALERTVATPFGDWPGDTFARFIVLDGLVHGWDLATATGQLYAPPDELVTAVEGFAEGAVPPLRDGDTFADAVDPAPSATPIERLAAFTGRQPPARP